METTRDILLNFFKHHRKGFYDCFSLSVDLGLDLHDTALAILDLEKEYAFEIKTKQVPFPIDPCKLENKDRYVSLKTTEDHPVNFYRFTGHTLHETAALGDNRHVNWRNMLRFIRTK